MYLAPACTFWLVIGCGLLELGAMREAGAFGVMAAAPAKFLAAAVMGFAVNSLAYVVIQVCAGGMHVGVGGGGGEGEVGWMRGLAGCAVLLLVLLEWSELPVPLLPQPARSRPPPDPAASAADRR